MQSPSKGWSPEGCPVGPDSGRLHTSSPIKAAGGPTKAAGGSREAERGAGTRGLDLSLTEQERAEGGNVSLLSSCLGHSETAPLLERRDKSPGDARRKLDLSALPARRRDGPSGEKGDSEEEEEGEPEEEEEGEEEEKLLLGPRTSPSSAATGRQPADAGGASGMEEGLD